MGRKSADSPVFRGIWLEEQSVLSCRLSRPSECRELCWTERPTCTRPLSLHLCFNQAGVDTQPTSHDITRVRKTSASGPTHLLRTCPTGSSVPVNLGNSEITLLAFKLKLQKTVNALTIYTLIGIFALDTPQQHLDQ